MTARKDTRPVVELCKIKSNFCGPLHYAGIMENKIHLSVGCYTRRADAKRGMVRFLRRIGADPAMVRWEGEG